MSENIKEKKIDKTASNTTDGENSGFLKRWSSLKSGKMEDEQSVLDKNNVEENSLDKVEEEESKMSDEELFEKYEVSNPESINSQIDLRDYMGKNIPDRLKQLALRRLWKIVPLYGEVSELVEYGEDFTDSATVIEGMQTAYEIGKGYANKIIEKTDKLIEVEESFDSEKEKEDIDPKKFDQTHNKETLNDDQILSDKDDLNEKISKTSESLDISSEIENKNTRPKKMIFKKV